MNCSVAGRQTAIIRHDREPVVAGLWLTILLLSLFSGVGASAEFYKWRDRQGVWHFSDRPPPDQLKLPSDPKNQASTRLLGMTYQQVIDQLGKPTFVFRTPETNRMRLVYGNDLLYLVDNVVTANRPQGGVAVRNRTLLEPGDSYLKVIETWGEPTREQRQFDQGVLRTELVFGSEDTDRVVLVNNDVIRIERH